MSISFSQFNIGNQLELTHAGMNLSSDLFDIGFCTRNTIVSVCYDEIMNAFTDQEDLGLPPNQVITGTNEWDILKQKTGFSISYINPKLELTLTVRLINHNDSSICILEISDRHFYTLFKPENKSLLVSILLASAKSINATAGFGAMEIEWEAYQQNDVIEFLKDGPPEYEGKQPPTGIINTRYLNSNPSLMKDLSIHFDFFIEEEYTILLRKGASELFSSIQR